MEVIGQWNEGNNSYANASGRHKIFTGKKGDAYHGTSTFRRGPCGLFCRRNDLTDTANLPVEPDVFAVKNWEKDWSAKGGKIDLWADVHSHSQRIGNGVFLSMDDYQMQGGYFVQAINEFLSIGLEITNLH